MASVQYEKTTIDKMIRLYCRKKHGSRAGELCPSCADLHRYAQLRLDKCPFGDQKPACKNCTIHCYKPDMKEQMRRVMRFAGPRMLIYHPTDFWIHLAGNLKKGKKGAQKRYL